MVSFLLGLCIFYADDIDSKSIKNILENADSFEFYSLEPLKKNEEGDKLHGWFVLGKVKIKCEEQKQIIESLYKSIADSNGVGARCFAPRHGIRAKKGEETVDLLVCFECYKVLIIKGDKRGQETLTASAQKVFDKILEKHNITLAKQPKK